MKTYRHLHLYERQLLELLLEEGKSKRQIARELGRSHTTIIRELKRNKHPFPGVSRRLSALEKAKYKHERAKSRWRKSKKRQKLKNNQLREHVIEQLNAGWSPEQIAGDLQWSLPGQRICAKSIYNFTKYERLELMEYLRRRGKPYRQRLMHRRGAFKHGVPDKRSISERSALVNDREEFGHWEADTVVSNRKGAGGVLTLQERKSRHRYYFIIKDLKAETVIRILLPFFQRLPSELCKSLTLDNGSEFATSEMYKLEQVIKGFKVYYCHPYKAYERGSVENANGWLREYYPKGTDFSQITNRELETVQAKLNARPMKLHRWRSANYIFNEALVNVAA